MVAVSVAVVISTSSHRCRPVAVVISTSDHWSVVSSLSLYRRHQTSVLSLFHAEREHALGHRQMMTQMFRHGTFSGLGHQHQTCIRSESDLGGQLLYAFPVSGVTRGVGADRLG